MRSCYKSRKVLSNARENSNRWRKLLRTRNSSHVISSVSNTTTLKTLCELQWCFLLTMYLYLHCNERFITISVCNCHYVGLAVCPVYGKKLDRRKALCYIFRYTTSEATRYECRWSLIFQYNKSSSLNTKPHLKKFHSMQIVSTFQSNSVPFHDIQWAEKCWCDSRCLKFLKQEKTTSTTNANNLLC